VLGRLSALAAVVLALGAVCALPAAAPAGPVGLPVQIATGLDTPWEVVHLDGGRTLVTERPGRITEITGGTVVFEDSTVADVIKFLGLARRPDHPAVPKLYLYETYDDGEGARSRIIRLHDTGSELTFDGVIFDGIGSDRSHDGGRIAFGPDGKLYVTTGDIHQPSRPRDIFNLNGKILRMNPDGSAPADNPLYAHGGNARYVWSYGHRHPQGLAWDDAGRLWETEHGPSGEGHAPAGASNGRDELNLILPGCDYGWPAVAGDQRLAGTIAPVWHSGPAPALAPGDLAWSPADGMLYAPGLAGTRIQVFEPDGAGGIARTGTIERIERMRAGVAHGSELWLTTDEGGASKVVRYSLSAGDAGVVWSNTPAPGASPAGTRCSVPVPAIAPPSPSSPAPAAQPPAAGPSASPAVLTRRRPQRDIARSAVRRVATTLRRAGLRRILRLGVVRTRAGGFAAGRVTLRLELRRARRRALTVAVGTTRVRSRAPVTLRAKVTKRGRRALRRLRSARIAVRLVHTSRSGRKTTQTAVLSVRRLPTATTPRP